MPTIRAILINPRDKTIEEIDHGPYADHGFAEALGCDMICTVPLPSHGGRRHMLITDDEGLFVPDQRFFSIAGYPQPIGGPSVIVGVGDAGETLSATVPLAVAIKAVSWLDDIAYAGDVPGPDDGQEVDGPFGKMRVISSIATFRKKGGEH